jgi:hypothetical protein
MILIISTGMLIWGITDLKKHRATKRGSKKHKFLSAKGTMAKGTYMAKGT